MRDDQFPVTAHVPYVQKNISAEVLLLKALYAKRFAPVRVTFKDAGYVRLVARFPESDS